MALFDIFKTKQPLEKQIVQGQEAEGDFNRRNMTITDYFNFGTDDEAPSGYDGIITALYRRYFGTEIKGREVTKTCIDYRTSWISGNGINIESSDKKVQDFLSKFIKYNRLDGSFFRTLVTHSELEGQILIVPYWQSEKVLLKHFAYYNGSYGRVFDENNRVVKIKYKDVNKTDQELTEGKFVYGSFGSIQSSKDIAPPKTGYVLYSIDAISSILRDMRKNNLKFGKVFPVFEHTDNDNARQTAETIKKNQWKIGDALSMVGTAKYLEPSGGAINSLEKEFMVHARIISNMTGIPVYFIAPDLMSNRATAEELQEMINSATMTERENWKDIATRICQIAIKMEADRTGAILDYEDVSVSIPPVSLNQVKQLMEVYFPLATDRIISRQTLREMVPNIDPELEIKRLKEEEEYERPKTDTSSSNTATEELKKRLEELENGTNI